jgi:hypothetical protein
VVLDAKALENAHGKLKNPSIKFFRKSDCLPQDTTKLRIPRPLVVMKKISTPLLISLCFSAPLVAETYDAHKLNRLGNSRDYETKPKFSQMIQALRRQTNVEMGEDDLEKPWAPLEDPIAPTPVKMKVISEVSSHDGSTEISTPDLTAEQEAKAVDLYREPITRKETFKPREALPERVKTTESKIKEEQEQVAKSKTNSFFDRLMISSKEEAKPTKKPVSKAAEQDDSGLDLFKIFKKFKFNSDDSKDQTVPDQKVTERVETTPEQHDGIIKNFSLGGEAEQNPRKKLQRETSDRAQQQNHRNSDLKLEVQKREKANVERKAKLAAKKKGKLDAEKKMKQKAKRAAEMKAKAAAEQKAKRAAEMKAKAAAEQKAKREADVMAKLEADKQAAIEADKKSKNNMLPANPEYIRRYKKYQESQSKTEAPKVSRRQKKANQEKINSPIQKIIY